MFKLYVQSDVNGKFYAFLDILHYYCDILLLINVVYLKESQEKLDH